MCSPIQIVLFQSISGISCEELLLPIVSNVFYDVITNASGCCPNCVNITTCEAISTSPRELLTYDSQFTYSIFFTEMSQTPSSSDLIHSLEQTSVAFSSSLSTYAKDVNSSALLSIARSASFGLPSVSVGSTSPSAAPSTTAQALENLTPHNTPASVVASVVVGSVVFTMLFIAIIFIIRRIYCVSRTLDTTAYTEIESKPNAVD